MNLGSDDKYFCPSGCTYAMVNEHSKLKYPVVDPNDAAGEKACDCHDGDDCPHVIPRSDFPKLKEGMMLYAMWPFDECHYYKGSVLLLSRSDTLTQTSSTVSTVNIKPLGSACMSPAIYRNLPQPRYHRQDHHRAGF